MKSDLRLPGHHVKADSLEVGKVNDKILTTEGAAHGHLVRRGAVGDTSFLVGAGMNQLDTPKVSA